MTSARLMVFHPRLTAMSMSEVLAGVGGVEDDAGAKGTVQDSDGGPDVTSHHPE